MIILRHIRVFRFPSARFSRVDFWQNWYVLQQKMIKKSNNPEVLTSNTWATKKRNCINKTLTALAVIINRTLRLLTFFTSLSSLIHPHFLNGDYSTCDVIVEFWLLRIGQQIDATKASKYVNGSQQSLSKTNDILKLIKMSHSIHMPSIQIDTKSLQLVIQH